MLTFQVYLNYLVVKRTMYVRFRRSPYRTSEQKKEVDCGSRSTELLLESTELISWPTFPRSSNPFIRPPNVWEETIEMPDGKSEIYFLLFYAVLFLDTRGQSWIEIVPNLVNKSEFNPVDLWEFFTELRKTIAIV